MQTSEESQPVVELAPTAPVETNDEQRTTDLPPVGEPAVHLPPSSIWPMTTAGGVALGGFGLVTTPVFSFLGLLLMFAGIFYWIQELRHESH